MAHAAQITDTPTTPINGLAHPAHDVLRVIVVPDSVEEAGRIPEFCAVDLGLGGTWVQTSYNANIPKVFAQVDGHYDPVAGVFFEQAPYASWVLDAGHEWQAPVPYPNDGADYVWDEAVGDWVVVEDPAA